MTEETVVVYKLATTGQSLTTMLPFYKIKLFILSIYPVFFFSVPADNNEINQIFTNTILFIGDSEISCESDISLLNHKCINVVKRKVTR